jgi:hypothetical protein
MAQLAHLIRADASIERQNETWQQCRRAASPGRFEQLSFVVVSERPACIARLAKETNPALQSCP